MYQVRKLHRGLITGLCLLLLVSCTWASVISVPELTFQSPGEVITGDILLDSAPNGISGYNITLSLADTDIGEITTITFPEWAGLKGNSPLPGSFVVIKAVDTGNLVEPNSTGILLAQVSVTSKKAGSTSLQITVNLLEDNAGNPIIKTATSIPSTTTTSAIATVTQSGGGSGISYAGTGISSGNVARSQEITSPVTTNPSKESMTPENVTGPGSSMISQPSVSSADTQVPSVAVSPTKSPFMQWVVLCALFCTGVIIRYKKSG